MGGRVSLGDVNVIAAAQCGLDHYGVWSEFESMSTLPPPYSSHFRQA